MDEMGHNIIHGLMQGKSLEDAERGAAVYVLHSSGLQPIEIRGQTGKFDTQAAKDKQESLGKKQKV
jgi:hypothetical protein